MPKIAENAKKMPKNAKKGQNSQKCQKKCLKMPKKVKNKTCNFIFNYETTLLQM